MNYIVYDCERVDRSEPSIIFSLSWKYLKYLMAAAVLFAPLVALTLADF